MSTAGNVSAVLVTRGDVDLSPIVSTFLPHLFSEVVVWNNDARGNHAPELQERAEAAAHVPVVWANTEGVDLVVYGRYAAIRATRSAVVYVQDDDCVLPPASLDELVGAYEPGRLVANMPDPFRAHYSYGDSCLVGFGGVFDVGLPAAAIDRFLVDVVEPAATSDPVGNRYAPAFMRCCDVVFTALTPMTWVDVAYENLPYATGPDRMYRQRDHVGERAWMLGLARGVRDA